MGTPQKHSVSLLIDSGSSSNFISESLTVQMSNWSLIAQPISVLVADGRILLCTHEITNCPLTIQGHLFYITLKILPLGCYDIILGMDWLEFHSPVVIYWKLKSISFDYHTVNVTLQGQPSEQLSWILLNFCNYIILMISGACWRCLCYNQHQQSQHGQLKSKL